MRYIAFICLLSLTFASCETAAPTTLQDKEAILQVMSMQEQAWNNGDLPAFMEGYWKSDQLQFVGKAGITKGWQQALERYQASYPTKAAMGKLSFDVLQLEPISADTYHMVGKYILQVGETQPSGHFTLLWKRIDAKWLITLDHSS